MGSFTDEQGRVINFTDGIVTQVEELDAVNDTCLKITQADRPLIVQEASPGDFSLGSGDFTIHLRLLMPMRNAWSRWSRNGHILDSYDAVNQVGWFLEHGSSNTIDFVASDGTDTYYIARGVRSKNMYTEFFDRLAVVRRDGVIRLFVNDEVVAETYYPDEIGGRSELAICSGWHEPNNSSIASQSDVSGAGVVESVYVVKQAMFWNPATPVSPKLATQLSGTLPVFDPVYYPPLGFTIPYDTEADAHSANVIYAFTGGDASSESVNPAIGGVGRYLGGMNLVESPGSINPKVLMTNTPHSSLTSPMPNESNFGNEDFTIQFRIRIVPGSSRQAILFGTWFSRDNLTDMEYNGGWRVMYAYNAFFFYGQNVQHDWRSIFVEDGQWHDIMITRDSNKDMRFYLDGVLHADVSSEPANFNKTNGYFTIGYAGKILPRQFNNTRPGYQFENIVLTKGVARTPVEPIVVTEPAVEDDPFRSDVVLMFNGGTELEAVDASTSRIVPVIGPASLPFSNDSVQTIDFANTFPYDPTNTDTQIGEYRKTSLADRYNNNIIESNPDTGTGITWDNSSGDFDFGTGDFTLEARMDQGYSIGIFGLGNGDTGSFNLFNSSHEDITFNFGGDDILRTTYFDGETLDEMIEFSACRRNGILSLYSRGILRGSVFCDEDISNAGLFSVGVQAGLLEEVRVTKAARFHGDYTPHAGRMGNNQGASPIDPMTSAPVAYDSSVDPNFANVVYYAKGFLDDASEPTIFEAIVGNDIYMSPDAKAVVSSGSVNPRVLHLPNRLSDPSLLSRPMAAAKWDSGYALGSGDFTVSVRVKCGNFFVGGSIVEALTYEGNSWQIFIGDDGLPIIFTNSGELLGSTVNVADNNWHEIKFSRSSGTSTLSIDGVPDVTVGDATNYDGTPKGLVVGYEVESYDYYAGDIYVEEIKISLDAR